MRPIYKCLIGSHAYGLATETSDEDIRGVYVAATEDMLKLEKPQAQTTGPGEDERSYELEEFLRLATKANPNILEMLWSPKVLASSRAWGTISIARIACMSKRIATTYGGYATAQLQKVHNKENVAVRNKHAMHLCRLLLSGAHALRTGEMLVDVSQYRTTLLTIKHGGDQELEQGLEWANELNEDFARAKATTTLPDEPNFDLINNVLLTLRLRYMHWLYDDDFEMRPHVNLP